MNKKLASLTVNKSADYYSEVVKALEDAGFLLVLELETPTDKYYIIAKSEDEWMRILREWNAYLENLKRMRDTIYEGTKTDDGLNIHLSKEECDIIWNLLSSEANRVFSTPLEMHTRD